MDGGLEGAVQVEIDNTKTRSCIIDSEVCRIGLKLHAGTRSRKNIRMKNPGVEFLMHVTTDHHFDLIEVFHQIREQDLQFLSQWIQKY